MSEKRWDRAGEPSFGYEQGLEGKKKSNFQKAGDVLDPGLNPEEALIAKEEGLDDVVNEEVEKLPESSQSMGELIDAVVDERLCEQVGDGQADRRAAERAVGWSPKAEKIVPEPTRKNPENIGTRKDASQEVGFEFGTKGRKKNGGQKPKYKEQRKEASGF